MKTKRSLSLDFDPILFLLSVSISLLSAPASVCSLLPEHLSPSLFTQTVSKLLNAFLLSLSPSFCLQLFLLLPTSRRKRKRVSTGSKGGGKELEGRKSKARRGTAGVRLFLSSKRRSEKNESEIQRQKKEASFCECLSFVPEQNSFLSD